MFRSICSKLILTLHTPSGLFWMNVSRFMDWNGRYCPTSSPAGPPDQAPLGFFFWGLLKNYCIRLLCPPYPKLTENATEIIFVSQEFLNNVWKNIWKLISFCSSRAEWLRRTPMTFNCFWFSCGIVHYKVGRHTPLACNTLKKWKFHGDYKW